MSKPKIAYIDIENTPNLGWAWELFEQNILDVEQGWFMLSFAVKWNDGKTKVYALPDYKGYKRDKTNDKELVKDLWKILDEADYVIGHNVDNFDIKKANARFIANGLVPPSPYKTIDTLKIAKKNFKFSSNRLDFIAKYLQIGRKIPTTGFSLWQGCMDGNEAAWMLMKRYNKHDVDLTYDVYNRLQAWEKAHPNLNLLTRKHGACPHCTSDTLQQRGYRFTLTQKIPRYQCTTCGAWSSGVAEKIAKINVR